MAFLMKRPEPPKQDPNAPVMTLTEAMKQLNDSATSDKPRKNGRSKARVRSSGKAAEMSAGDPAPQDGTSSAVKR